MEMIGGRLWSCVVSADRGPGWRNAEEWRALAMRYEGVATGRAGLGRKATWVKSVDRLWSWEEEEEKEEVLRYRARAAALGRSLT